MNALTKFVNDVDEGDGTGSSGTGVGSSVIDTAFIASMAGAFVNVTTSGNLTLATPEGAEEIVPIDSVESIETSTEVSIVQVIVTTTTTTTTTTPFEYEYGKSNSKYQITLISSFKYESSKIPIIFRVIMEIRLNELYKNLK